MSKHIEVLTMDKCFRTENPNFPSCFPSWWDDGTAVLAERRKPGTPFAPIQDMSDEFCAALMYVFNRIKWFHSAWFCWDGVRRPYGRDGLEAALFIYLKQLHRIKCEHAYVLSIRDPSHFLNIVCGHCGKVFQSNQQSCASAHGHPERGRPHDDAEMRRVIVEGIILVEDHIMSMIQEQINAFKEDLHLTSECSDDENPLGACVALTRELREDGADMKEGYVKKVQLLDKLMLGHNKRVCVLLTEFRRTNPYAEAQDKEDWFERRDAFVKQGTDEKNKVSK